jgi:SagB-type dehydrogenase family enzyme
MKSIENVKSAFAEDSLETVILRRGSTRKFSHDAISLEQLSTILKRSTSKIISDFEEESISDIYLIANAVDGLEQGAYFYNKEHNSLELLQKGDFRYASGHLGLDQSLPYDASVTIFFMTNLQNILEHFGNRGYRVAQLDASIMGGRMYLASYALHIGATGLTFYDDEVTEFFSPHANNKNAMFMIAIGKKAKS